jgi:PhzF family phenazine biosynthesis protein
MLIATVDAFTREPFRGNPAATVRLSSYPEDMRMQSIAREMNLPETAFAVPLAPNRFRLRWFTPTREVPMCGHATLAMAHSLHEMGDVDPAQPLVFETLSGELTVRLDGDHLEMDFPAMFPVPDDQAARVRTILGSRSHEYLGCVPMNATAVLSTQREVAQFTPDLPLIAKLASAGLCITAPADPGRDYDFVARFFAPQSGIDEDPVTGSAYCTLAPYWAKRLGRLTLRARQLSARGGELTVTHAGNRVLLRGQAVTTMRGHIVA